MENAIDNILLKIVKDSRNDLVLREQKLPFSELKRMILDAQKNISFKANLLKKETAIIAELKKASPSKGVIREDFPVADLAKILAQNGAAALSVLTEENYFLGSLDNLKIARKNVEIPILRKDFIYSDYQIFEAKVFGANAILLIAAMLSQDEIKRFFMTAKELDLDVLCEVHNAQELEKAMKIDADIIGVNARNLATFHTDLQASADLMRQIPTGIIKVAESAIKTRSDIDFFQKCGAKAFLVGETLMREKNPGEILCKLLQK